MARVCIFGSRDGVDSLVVAAFVMSLPDTMEVVTGGARGVDYVAAMVAHHVCRCPDRCRHSAGDAEFRNLHTTIMRADWKTYGTQAGPIRNGKMVAYSDSGVAFRRDGISRGTDDCIRQFERAGKRVGVLKFTYMEE